MKIDPYKLKRLGTSNLSVPQLGFGAGALGDAWEKISESQAQQALSHAYETGIRYFDTAPWYGNTLSEHRVGHFLRQQPEKNYIISTKVGRIYFRNSVPGGKEFFQRWQGGLKLKLKFDYTREGILRSYEDSLTRMGINAVDSLVIHDLDYRHQIDDEGVDHCFRQLIEEGGYAQLQALKKAGEIKVIGAGINHIGMIPRFVEYFDLDYFLLAMPYTLLDQSALENELPLCEKNNIGIVIGAIFGSGILATGIQKDAKYGYKPADKAIIEKVKKIEAVCAEFNVSLTAAALQFPLMHPAVDSIIPGCNSAEQVQTNLSLLQQAIPVEFWQSLKNQGLIHEDSPIAET